MYIYMTGLWSPASQLFCRHLIFFFCDLILSGLHPKKRKEKSLTYHEQVCVQFLKVTKAIHWRAGGVVRQDDDIIVIILRRRWTLLSLDAAGHGQKVTVNLLYVTVFRCLHTRIVKVVCKWQTSHSKTSESEATGLLVLPRPQNWRELLSWSICGPASAQKIRFKVK